MVVDTRGGRPPRRAALAGIPVPRAGRAAAPVARALSPRRPARWTQRYRAGLVASDAALGALAGSTTLILQPGGALPPWIHGWTPAVLLLLWPLVQTLAGSHAPRYFGAGSEEFRAVARGGLFLLAGTSVLSYGAQLGIARSFVLLTVPALTLATLVTRFCARKWLARARGRGRCVKKVVAVGRDGAVADLVRRLQHDRYTGMDVVAACVPSPEAAVAVPAAGVPVEGDLGSVVDVVRRLGADAVAVTSASETAAVYLRSLSWQLEGSGIELPVSPGLIAVAGPRLHIRPFVGLPLLSIEEPVFAGWKRLLKTALDRTGAALAILLVAPALLGIALAVRLSGPGPVLFRQQRVGADGRLYTMLKFRSMVHDADDRLADLLALNESDGLLFKLRRDPRVTPVGRWLRRFSLDELPQLFNVLGGTMSLVGPRPPLPAEVEHYDSSIRRRLLVKPGLTGLWQISGRSDLSWEESVRLDLRYVENWSLALDLLILWKTAAAVVRSRGAY